MYVATIPNRHSPPAILLRESYREEGKVKTRTLANLSHWSPDKIAALRSVLTNQPQKANLQESFDITRSLAHGHIGAVLGTIRNLGLDTLIDPVPSRQRDLALAMIISQVIRPSSKLACARGLKAESATSSLGEVLSLSAIDENDLNEAMDWLGPKQSRIETELAKQHLVLPRISSLNITHTTVRLAS